MTDETESDRGHDTRLTRREALRGGSAAAVAAGSALPSQHLVRTARAASAGDARIIMGSAPDPNQNGEISYDGTDIKAYSGGSVRNLSNIHTKVTSSDIDHSATTGTRDHSGDDLTPNSVQTGVVDNDDYHETVVSQSGSTGDLDLTASNLFKQTITGNITFSFNNPNSSPDGNSFTLIIEQDGTGGHTVSWPASVEWGGGSAPNLDDAANAKHMLHFVTPDAGTTWLGTVSARQVA